MGIDRADNFIASLGVEAYRVGGSVRDELLGKQPKDADYMIRGVDLDLLGAKLRDMRFDWDKFSVKPLTLRDGRQAGWRVSARGMGVLEIVLPRTEISTGPGHRDFKIVVDHELPLAEDAKRRDFTFNALYKRIGGPPGAEIVDPTSRGLYDLERRIIATTHPDSFRDDPLRILRALRFKARGFDLSSSTYAEMATHHDAVDGLTASGYVSGTVYEELDKILAGDDVGAALRTARSTGVLAAVLPELEPMIGFDQGSRYHDMTTDEHTFTALETAAHVDAPQRVRWALLFHDAGKPATAWVGADGRKHYYGLSEAEWIKRPGYAFTAAPEDHEVVGERIWVKTANRLNVPASLRRDVATLIREHMVSVSGRIKGSKVRRARIKFGDEMLHDLYLHRMCDICGKNGKANRGHLEHVSKLETLRAEAQEAKVPASIKDLAVGGKDVMALGAEGKQIGVLLSMLLDEVVVDPSPLRRTYEWQMERLETMRR